MNIKTTMLQWWAAMLGAPNVIFDRAGTSPYLSRYYITSRRDGEEEEGTDREVNVFLHRFHRGDDDKALHNHPWEWAFSLVLSGGYREELRVGDRVCTREFRPGNVNILMHDTYHRVDLLGEECWTLFVAGPKAKDSWGFWDRVTRRRTPWRAFIDELRKGEPAPWVDDRREERALMIREGVCDALTELWAKLEELMRIVDGELQPLELEGGVQLIFRPVGTDQPGFYAYQNGHPLHTASPIAEMPVTTQYRAALKLLSVVGPIAPEDTVQNIERAEAAAALAALGHVASCVAERNVGTSDEASA